MSLLQSALIAWQNAIGAEHVLSASNDADALSAAQTATFHTTQRIPAILRPVNRAEVQACVQIANQYQIALYPVSTGKNWGYGSRVPVQDNCVLMELARLDQITDYSEELAYVTVQPGVTQQQLYDYLQAQGGQLMMSVTGSSPDSSLIGNTMERGIGKGIYGDRFAHVCGLEVVMPTGECIHTGFGRFPHSSTTSVHRWGVGPYLDGLFTQSNLGIVTEMTLWLQPTPHYTQTFFYAIKDDAKLEGLVDALRVLRLQGLLRGTFVLANDHRMLAIKQQYPWHDSDGDNNGEPLSADKLATLRKTLRGGVWLGEGALFSASKAQGRAERRLIKRALRPHVDQLNFFDAKKASWMQRFAPLYRRLTGFDMGKIMDMLYQKNLQRGIPSAAPIAMSYWKKRQPVPTEMNPDRDGCGLIWCAPVVPCTGQHVRKALTIIEQSTQQYRFEFDAALNFASERALEITVALLYDREQKNDDQRALVCREHMLTALCEAGYIPYRVDIDAMKTLANPQDDYINVLQTLKQQLDPQDILAPERYDFRHLWSTTDKEIKESKKENNK